MRPDLTCLGKIIGGGLPVGAFGGRADVMSHLAPIGSVYQAGTLSGNPLAVSAGLAILRLLKGAGVYEQLERLGARLERGLRDAAAEAGAPATINRVGSMLTAFFTKYQVKDWPTAKKSDTDRYGGYFRAMLDQGIYFAPSQFECAFVSLAHTDDLIDKTVGAARTALSTVAG